MENELLVEQAQPKEILMEQEEAYVPEIRVFRDYVDHQPMNKSEEIMIKLLYLLGARASEIITKVSPRQLELNMTHPYGKLLSWKIVSYKKMYVEDGKEKEKVWKVLLVRSAVAKSKKTKITEASPETTPQQTTEQPQPKEIRVPMKELPIILDPVCEPWCIDILKWIQAHKATEDALRFNCTEMTVQNIIHRNLNGLKQVDPNAKNANIHPHLLRHWRITHLQTAYDFTPLETCAFTKWSIKAQQRQKGIAVSSNIDLYSHLSWRDFIDKLLVPLSEVL